MEVIEDWGFASKLGYFVIEKALNNGIKMKPLSQLVLASASSGSCLQYTDSTSTQI